MDQPPRFDAEHLPTLCPALHHVNLKTNRLQEMIDWYGKVVGSKVIFQRHDMAFLTNDEANHRVALVAMEEYAEPGRRENHVGMHHSAFEYRSLDELLQSWVRLEWEGLMPRFCVNHGPTTSFYYQDPDGNFVELQCDNWYNAAQSGGFMRLDPHFSADPIGSWVDPPKMIEARESGMSQWEVHLASLAGRLEPVETPNLGPVD